jgi:hypothetical protein
MAGSITFDDALWPLLRIQFSGMPTMEQVEEYLARRLGYMLQEEPHVILYDTRQARLLPTELRQRHVDWMREHKALRERTVRGYALILTSPFLQLTLQVVIHMWPARLPYRVVTQESAAAAWCADRLRELGLTEAATRIRHHYRLPPPPAP